MTHIQIINDEGYKSLRSLVHSNPALFTDPNPQKLAEQMAIQSGTDSVYGASLELKTSLESLNFETESGPKTDAVHARTIREALSGITPASASDGLLWASINCFVIAEYVPIRWATSNNQTAKPASFVEDHWLQYSGSAGRKWNAAARLWWMGELANRISRYSQHTPDELLEVMSNNVQFYHQTIDRTYLAANPKLLGAMYDVFLDGNDHLNVTKNASEMLKSLNIRAGATALDMMDYDELRAVIEEAKPPKER